MAGAATAPATVDWMNLRRCMGSPVVVVGPAARRRGFVDGQLIMLIAWPLICQLAPSLTRVMPERSRLLRPPHSAERCDRHASNARSPKKDPQAPAGEHNEQPVRA